MFHSLSGASRWSDYAAVSRVVRLSQYTCSGVLPSSARCGLLLVIECQVALQALVRGADGLVGVQIHLLVFDALPESFHEHVVAPAAFPVHADLNAVVFQEPRELLAGELAPLIGVEDVGRAIAGHGLLDRLQTEVGRQRVGQPPRQHPATRPVQDRKQIHEAPLHRNVGDIGRPDMIGRDDRQIAQQIGIDRMGGMPAGWYGASDTGPRCPCVASGCATCLRPIAWPSRRKQIAQHAGAGKRMGQMELVDPTHQRQLCRRHRRRLVVRRRASQLQELALPHHWQGVGSVDHRFALSKPALMSAPSKKSFSSASWPILAWRVLRSGVSGLRFVPPNTSAARASNCCFHSVIWVVI